MSRNAFRLLMLPGDGIGPEVIAEARRVLDWFVEHRDMAVDVAEGDVGYAAYVKHGTLLSEETMQEARRADAILFGAVGGPEFEALSSELRHSSGLFRLRRELDLYANLRPVRALSALETVSPLRADVVRDVDLVIVRELTSGIYFGTPRGVENLSEGGRRAFDTQEYTTEEVKRIARFAFELARQRRGRLTCVDKSNVLESGTLWRQEVTAVGQQEFPDVTLDYMYVDNCAMQLILNPRQFDVIVADNMLGDILSDGAGAILGSLGMLPSASLGATDAEGRRHALYEPVHGSAPDIAGRGLANPLAAIMSLGMALRHSFNRPSEAELLDRAIEAVLADGVRTADIAPPGTKPVSTQEMGSAVLAALSRIE